MTKDEMIEWIDNASLFELLFKWRFSPSGNPFFVGEVGEHFKRVLFTKRDAASSDEWSKVSKLVGWSNNRR